MPPPPTPTLIPSQPHPQPHPHLQPQNQSFFNTVLNSIQAPAPAPANSPNTTPPRAGRNSSSSAKNSPKWISTVTPAQRSAQARGKPYDRLAAGESYEAKQRREEAAKVLDSLEMLVWHSNARNESLSQTRTHFQNIVLGLKGGDGHVKWKEEWEVPESHRVRRGDEDTIIGGSGASPSRGGKGKERDEDRRKKRPSGVGLQATTW